MNAVRAAMREQNQAHRGSVIFGYLVMQCCLFDTAVDNKKADRIAVRCFLRGLQNRANATLV